MVWTSSWDVIQKAFSPTWISISTLTVPWRDFFLKKKKNVYELILTLVLPGLVGPEGQTVRTCRRHGDLWDGIDNKIGHVYIFDVSSFYGHNKLELGELSCHSNRMSWDV